MAATKCGFAQQPPPQPPAPPPPTPGITQVIQPPPAPPPPPELPQQDEGKFSIEPDAFILRGHPIFNSGAAYTDTSTAARVVLPGKNSLSFGGNVRVPAGKHNAIRVTYMEVKGSGTYVAPTALDLWGGGFNAGDSIISDYRVRYVNFSFDYLTWPWPPAARKFRLKTLWQVQYASVNSSFLAPESTNVNPTGSGSKTIILPALGLGVTEYFAKNARVEANASGFAIPGHSALANVDADVAYKFGILEIRAGAKLFYFKSSPKSDFDLKGRLTGAFVGIRLYAP
ncbi:MAG: hypothetical protein JO336_13135 [Acidobacteriia bacterium]|nr:hypothetical protein [Terriglobia bacterium]MBV8904240.1 hypothetical protein [Terriglobia bacterium]